MDEASMHGPVVNETILKLALAQAVIPEPAGKVAVTGVPGVDHVFVKTDADTGIVEVHGVNGERLPDPIRIALVPHRAPAPPPDLQYGEPVYVTVRATDLPSTSVPGRDGTRWAPVVGGGFRAEPQSIDAATNDVIAQVDTGVYCWALHCDCGRVRYAKRNSIHQVSLCRVCTTRKRKAQRRR